MNVNRAIKILEGLLKEQKENEFVEFKRNNKEPNSLGEYISALSNSACLHSKKFAYLVFGIDNNTHSVVGTNFKPGMEKKGNEELENWLHRHLKPDVDFNISEFIYKGKNVVLFIIDSAFRTPVSFNGTSYIRIGSYKKKLSDYPDKERKIWLQTEKQAFEEIIALDGVSDDEILSLLDYPSYFDLLNLKLPDNKQAIITKLEEDRLIVRNPPQYDITNLGAILFAKQLSKFDRLKRKSARVIIYKGNNRLKAIKEQEGGKGYAIGFEGLVNYVNEHLPSYEEIGSAFRQEGRIYPKLAIRELIANSLIHQDFSISGSGPMIEIFKNRIEISNPGKPLIETLRFIDHSPRSRNEKLAYFMRRINICEERGSGIDKVINVIESHQLPAPNFIEEEQFLRVVLYSYKLLRDIQKDDRIRATYQHCCLKHVSNELMSNSSLRGRFNIDKKNYSIVSRIIADTIQKGLIKEFDPLNKSRKYAKYVPYWA